MARERSAAGAGASAGAGRRVPAEWEPHRATWVAWPTNRETWPGLFERAERAFAEMVRALRRFEPVRVLLAGETARDTFLARRDLGAGHALVPHLVATDDAWVRDYGPIFVAAPGGNVIATEWRFDAWGGKYPPWERDAAATAAIARASGLDRERVDRVLEGGSIDSNGLGTLLTTETCLLSPSRNGGLEREVVEAILERHLGARRVLWLAGELAGDDTDGHVDQLCRFVGPRVVVVAVEPDPLDENFASLRENRRRLEEMRDQDGRPLRVVELPMPEPVVHQGERLPASYTNFLVVNGGVLVPRFGRERDLVAEKILAGLFPDREVVGVDARDLVVGLGAIHCLTRDEPAGERGAGREGAGGVYSRVASGAAGIAKEEPGVEAR